MAKMNNNVGTFSNSSPNWNKTGTEPPASMKSKGFKAGYKPPAGFFNWFWTKVSKCITELQSKITSIVSFLSTDDFCLYKTLSSCTKTSQVTGYATNSAYINGKYTLIFTVAEAAIISFDLTTSETAYMTFWSGIPVLHFPRQNKTFTYINNTWTKVYADTNPQETGHLRVRKFTSYNCPSLEEAYYIYDNYKDNYDIIYFDIDINSTMGSVGKTGRIDCNLGQLTTSSSSNTWRTDDTNNTFVLN